MKASVNDDCIGCRLCVGIAEEVFEMGETDTKASVKKGADVKKYEKEAKEAEEQCPVEAIKVG